MREPEVSVVMAVKDYNNGFLRQAVDSVLQQSMEDFELVVVDGASSDGTTEYIDSLDDNRINHVVLNRDPGFTEMLNIGVENSNGNYIARHDADDISRMPRLKRQARYLDKDKNISILGTSIRIIDNDGRITQSLIVDYNHDRVVKELRFGSAFAHGSVMVRRSVFDDYKYDPTMPRSQDYDLWLRISRDGNHKFRVISDPLYYWRDHSECVSNEDWLMQFVCAEFSRLRCDGSGVRCVEDVMDRARNGFSRTRMKLIARRHRRNFYSDEPLRNKAYDILICLTMEPSYWLNKVSKKIESRNLVEPIDYSEWNLCPNCRIMSVPPGSRICKGCQKNNFWWLD